MTASQIKFIALITMVIDHIWLFLLPQWSILHLIGRISFPLFAWLIANGAYHTRDLDQYLKRLLIFAAIAQVPYTLAYQQLNPNFAGLNVLFTLSLGLIGIKIIKQFSQKWLKVLAIIMIGELAVLLNVDYGIFGVLSIIAFYSYFKNFKMLVLSQIIILAILPLAILSLEIGYSGSFFPLPFDWVVEPLGLLALIFIHQYNNQEGFKFKWLLYIFYPLQFVIFYCLQAL